MNATDETLYSLYKNAGFSWPLAICAIMLNLCAISGIFLNFAVIWVTARSKSLHGTANFLLALCSFFELLHQHGHLLFLFVVLSGINFIPYTSAVHFCLVSIFGLGGIAPSMAFTGLDRLFCVVFPTFPKLVSQKFYLGTISLICAVLCTFNMLNFCNNNAPSTLMVTGSIGDLTSPAYYAGQTYANLSFAFNNATIAIYIVVGIILKLRTVQNLSSATGQNNMRIFRALLLIITINVGGYYAMRIYRMFLVPTINSQVSVWFLTQAFAVLLNLSAASNAPVLYFTSKDYRIAFRREWHRLWKCFGINTVQQGTTMIASMAQPKNGVEKKGLNAGHSQRFLTVVGDRTNVQMTNKMDNNRVNTTRY